MKDCRPSKLPKVQSCSRLYDKNDDCEPHCWDGMLGIEAFGVDPPILRIEDVGIRWSKLEARGVGVG